MAITAQNEANSVTSRNRELGPRAFDRVLVRKGGEDQDEDAHARMVTPATIGWNYVSSSWGPRTPRALEGSASG